MSRVNSDLFVVIVVLLVFLDCAKAMGSRLPMVWAAVQLAPILSLFADVRFSNGNQCPMNRAILTLATLLSCSLASANEAPSWQQLDDSAKALYQEARYDDAAATMRRSLALVEKQYGPNDASVARHLNNLALILKAQQRYAEAESLYRRAVVIADKVFGEDDPDGMKSLGDLARLYVVEGKYTEAEPLYLRLVDWQQKHIGPQFGDVANTQAELSGLYSKLGRTEDADRLMRRSFASIGEPARAQGLVPTPSDVFSDAQKSAAVAIDIGRRHNETLADSCISRSKDNEFRFSLHLWQIENFDVTLPTEHVLATIPAEWRRALEHRLGHAKTPDAAPNEALCGLLSRSMRNGQLDYARTDADAAKTMRAIYAADDSLRIAKRDADLGAGCLKHHYNAGERAFGQIRALCECQTRAIKANGTDKQIDVWLAELDARTGGTPGTGREPGVALAASTLHHDWITKALEAAAHCTNVTP